MLSDFIVYEGLGFELFTELSQDVNDAANAAAIAREKMNNGILFNSEAITLPGLVLDDFNSLPFS